MSEFDPTHQEVQAELYNGKTLDQAQREIRQDKLLQVAREIRDSWCWGRSQAERIDRLLDVVEELIRNPL
jgi:hypothetical protein